MKLYMIKIKFGFFVKRIKVAVSIFTFGYIWLIIATVFLAIIALAVSIFYNKSNELLSSIFANIFAGLVTGLVLFLISGVKNANRTKLELKLAMLEEIKNTTNEYRSLERDLRICQDTGSEFFNKSYDTIIAASNIIEAVIYGYILFGINEKFRVVLSKKKIFDVGEINKKWLMLREKLIDYESCSFNEKKEKREIFYLFDIMNDDIRSLTIFIGEEIIKARSKQKLIDKSFV